MTSHYFTNSVPATDKELRDVEVKTRGLTLKMKTADKVFSGGGLDSGTKVLLGEVPAPPAEGTFLDIGCGWGPIAAVMAKESPAANVWAVDVSDRALDLTRKNAAALGLKNISVMSESEAVQRADTDGTIFDLIWSNPPVRIGKQALKDLLSLWLGRLSPDGVAFFVISKNLGGDSIATWLGTQGFSVQRVGSKQGFRVLRVSRAQ